MLVNIIATIIVVAALGGAIAYVVKAKKSGKKCIGCPDSKTCANGACSTCSCHCARNADSTQQ